MHGVTWPLHPIGIMVRKGAVYTVIILSSDALGLGIDSMILSRNMFHYYTLFTLAQAALLFLVGGVMDVTGSLSFSRLRDHAAKTERKWNIDSHRRAQSRAAPFIITAIILLVLSFVLAYPLN